MIEYPDMRLCHVLLRRMSSNFQGPRREQPSQSVPRSGEVPETVGRASEGLSSRPLEDDEGSDEHPTLTLE